MTDTPGPILHQRIAADHTHQKEKQYFCSFLQATHSELNIKAFCSISHLPPSHWIRFLTRSPLCDDPPLSPPLIL